MWGSPQIWSGGSITIKLRFKGLNKFVPQEGIMESLVNSLNPPFTDWDLPLVWQFGWNWWSMTPGKQPTSTRTPVWREEDGSKEREEGGA
jgi:hypothetical protein